MNRQNKFNQQNQQQQFQQNWRYNESDEEGMYYEEQQNDIEFERQSPLAYNNYNTFNNQQQNYTNQFENQNQYDEESLIIENPLDQTPIQVMIRVRPQFNIDSQSALKIVDNNTIYINNNENVHSFKYSRVFKPSDNQETIFKYVCEPILQHAIQGYNASFLVYGQTGTGKTHTMGLHQNNLLEEPGMIQHSLKFLFDHFNSSQLNPEDWSISLNFMQIYIEEIFDLLNPNGQKLQIREDSESNEVYVQDLITVPIKNIDQAIKLIEAGLNQRMLGPQNMNQYSSRSHTILNVYVNQRISYSEYIVSNIAFVDLAGSERIKKSNSTGIRMEEAKKINSSLSALSNVISLLGNSNQQYIPYRDSKLTRILQNCLNSQSKISIIGTVEPSEDNSFETYSTLLFASRCQDIQFLPQQNLQNIFTMNSDPQEEIQNLKDQIKYYQNKIKKMSSSMSSDGTKFAKQIIETLKRPFTKLGRNLKQAQKMNEQLYSQMKNKKNIQYEPIGLYQAKMPFEEMIQMISDGKEQEFLNLFEQSFEDIFQKYGQISLELEKLKEVNLANQSQKTEDHQQLTSSRPSTKLATELIEYYSGFSQTLLKQLLESEQIADKNEKDLLEKIEDFNQQTQLKLKDIVKKHNIKELNQYIETFNETNYEKIAKSESYRVKQLVLQLKKKIEETASKNNDKSNTNIRDFLEKQRLINEKKFMIKQSGTPLNNSQTAIDNSSSMSVRSNSSSNNQTQQQQNQSQVNSIPKGPSNLKLMMNDLNQRKKQQNSNQVNENQENFSSQQDGNYSSNNINNSQSKKQSSTPIHIQRVKILNEDLIEKNPQSNFETNKLTEQNTNIAKPDKQNISEKKNIQQANMNLNKEIYFDRSSSSGSNKQDYNTSSLSPIPQEQQLNSQLKSCNFYKKNQKYSPFTDN
ncbi:hypothetical protein ABPG74_017643 [Tetrahymena malaccensis]